MDPGGSARRDAIPVFLAWHDPFPSVALLHHIIHSVGGGACYGFPGDIGVIIRFQESSSSFSM